MKEIRLWLEDTVEEAPEVELDGALLEEAMLDEAQVMQRVLDQKGR